MSASKYLPLEMRDGTVLNVHIIDGQHPVWLIISHGVCEHLERYDEFVERYQDRFNILRYDLRGHGKSQGKTHSIDHFDNYAKDLKELVSYLHKRHGMNRYVLFGHSMGGLITAQYIQKICNVKNISGSEPGGFLHGSTGQELNVHLEQVFLSSPCIAPANVLVSAVRMLPEFMDIRAATGVTMHSFIREALLSHATKTDPIYKDLHLSNMRMSLKLMLAVTTNSNHTFRSPLQTSCPIKAVIGTGDSIVSVPAFKNYFEKMEISAEVLYIDGGFHELMHETPEYKDPYYAFVDKCFDEVILRNPRSRS